MLDGRELTGRTVRQVLDAGAGFVPEDRQHDGLVPEFTIAENLMLDRSDGAPVRAVRRAAAEGAATPSRRSG